MLPSDYVPAQVSSKLHDCYIPSVKMKKGGEQKEIACSCMYFHLHFCSIRQYSFN